MNWVVTRGSKCVRCLWSAAEPSQNKKRKARPTKTDGRINVQLLEDDDLDKGEDLHIYALQSWKTKTEKQNPRSAPSSCHFSLHIRSLLDRHAFDLRAPGVVFLFAFVSSALHHAGRNRDAPRMLPAPRHATSHPITVGAPE